MPIPISAIVITRDEEETLPRCLASLAWANDILVVDSYSTDRTVEIARNNGARVIQHPFSDFASQRNYAQSQAVYDWVLFIDADEEVSPQLRDNIVSLAQEDKLPEFNAYFLHRVQLFSGCWWPDPDKPFMPANLRSGPHVSSVGFPHLFDRRLGKWKRPLHEIIPIPMPHGIVNGVLYHYSTSNLSLAHSSLNSYTNMEAAHLHQSRNRVSLLEAIARGLRNCLYHYFLLKFYRLGEQGLLWSIMLGYYKFLDYAKLSERIRIQSGRGFWTERDRQLLVKFSRRDEDV